MFVPRLQGKDLVKSFVGPNDCILELHFRRFSRLSSIYWDISNANSGSWLGNLAGSSNATGCGT
jgi:hypothetical protein